MAQKVLQRPPPGLDEAKEKISATEELCVEHAMLDRIMLAMDRSLKLAGNSPKGDLDVISKSCDMIQNVIDAHHMKFEEEAIYPKFEKDAAMKTMMSELKLQHDEARKMVTMMSELSKGGQSRDMEEMKRIFHDFHDMMTAHAAMEESVLFIAMEGTWSDDQLQELKEMQEKDEEEKLGEDADEKVYEMLSEIESAAGIESLADFTRKAK